MHLLNVSWHSFFHAWTIDFFKQSELVLYLSSTICSTIVDNRGDLNQDYFQVIML